MDDDGRRRNRAWRFVAVAVSIFNILIFGGSLAVAYWANSISVTSNEIASQNVKAEIFINLRSRYFAVLDQFPKDVRQLPRAPERSTEEWKSIRAYWEQAFNEWYTTNHLFKEHTETLWTDYYRDVLQCVMQFPAFRDVFYQLKEEEFSHGRRREFFTIVSALAAAADIEARCGKRYVPLSAR